MDVYCRSNISALNEVEKDTSVQTQPLIHTYRYEHTHTLKYTEVFSNNC